MQIVRRALLLVLIVSFAATGLPAVAQQVIATVPVGIQPGQAAVNPVTNKIYVANLCGDDPNCHSNATVTAIDGVTNNTRSVNVGYYPGGTAVNPVTNRIYIPNQCGDPFCQTHDGTVSVIDGVSNNVIATVPVGYDPYGLAVNSVTNKIYVVNTCGDDQYCQYFWGTMSVIDGASNTVVATVNVGLDPGPPVVNSLTNKIYVPDSWSPLPCGGYPPYRAGAVTIIDGTTNDATLVNAGICPDGIDFNSVTNKIYVPSDCLGDPSCHFAPNGTVTVIDGVTLGTTSIPTGATGSLPDTIVVNSAANKIYVANPSCTCLLYT